MIPVVAFLGSGATITVFTTWFGISTSLELQLLIFINVSVLQAILLRKHLSFPEWFRSERETSSSATMGLALSDTSRFLTTRMGLKRIPSEESSRKHRQQKSRNEEVGKIVTVVVPINPYTTCGKVKYRGVKWQAKSSEPIARGEHVRIVGRDILTLIVVRVTKQSTVKKPLT